MSMQKYAAYGVVRTVPPSETIRRVQPLMSIAGITRVAEVTGLDHVGIPNFIAVRPREHGDGISYYNGKGVTRAAAKAGALMEAIERYSGEFCDLPVHYGTRAEMLRALPAVDPGEIVAPMLKPYRPDIPIEWVEGLELISMTAMFVPLNVVVCPYDPPDGQARTFFESTNGLASGNTPEEALCHALCEVVERDAIAVSAASRDLGPAVARVLAGIGISASSNPRTPSHPRIDLRTLPPRALTLGRRLLRAGLRVYLRDVTSCVGIPTITCAIVESRADGHHVAHGGSGCHPDARVAVVRALTEAAQSRVAHIQGGREDLPAIVTPEVAFDPDEVFGYGEFVTFGELASYEHERVDEDISFILSRLSASGFTQAVTVDLTRPELGIPVVRVVVPRAETWSVYYTHIRRSRLGTRAVHAISESLDAGSSHV